MYSKEGKLFEMLLFSQNIKQHKFSVFFTRTLLIIINVSLAANQHIRMISEGSCDTEDWSNDAENSALITEIITF